MSSAAPASVAILDRPGAAPGALRRAEWEDLDAVADVLAASFDDDPVFRHLVRQDARRGTALRGLFRGIVGGLALNHGETYLAAGGDGVAVWLPPGETQSGLFDQLRLLPVMLGAAGPRGLPRFFRTLGVMDEHHPHAPHRYLMLLGVRPERQGLGIGSALLGEVLRRCDADGTPAYLEASSPRNRRLYERYGFVASTQVDLPDGGPPMWPMWREPNPTSG